MLGFCGGKAAGMAAVGNCQKLPPCQAEPIPSSSRTNPLLAKAGPIRNVCKASMMTYFSKKIIAQVSLQAEKSKVGRDSYADPQVSAGGGEGGVTGARDEIPLQLVVKTTGRQLCPCWPWRTIHGGKEINL